jgi:hypothetical protein
MLAMIVGFGAIHFSVGNKKNNKVRKKDEHDARGDKRNYGSISASTT